MSTRLAVFALAVTTLLAACDATVTEPIADRMTSVAVSPTFSCGLAGDGVALCWGDAGRGQLGDGTGMPHAEPIAVASGSRFSQVVVGTAHACGLATDGRAFCWGENHDSQLGQVDGDLDCVLRQSNGWDQDFGNDCSKAPVPVGGGLHFKTLGAGPTHTCGLTSGGEIWCWGSAWYPIGLAGGVYISTSAAPVKVNATAHFKAIAIGQYHACAADDEGQGWCWGSGWEGQTGLGTADSLTNFRPEPAPIASSTYLRAVTVSASHSCGLTSSGEAICWGAGSAGQRGDSTFGPARHNPTFVKTDRRFSAIAAGAGRTCAIEKGTGAAWCWGENESGSLGVGVYGADQFAPVQVIGGLAFSELSLPQYFAFENPPPPVCGTSGEGIYCWGQAPLPLTFEE